MIVFFLCILLSQCAPCLAERLDSETVRRTMAEVAAGPDYQLEKGLNDDSKSILQTLLTWILAPIFWLFRALHGLPPLLQILVTIVLTVVAIALIVHIIWSFTAAMRGTKVGSRSIRDREISVNPREMEIAAERAAAEGDYLQAIRLLFKAALLRIERAEKKKLRLGITNRELLRRYRSSPLAAPLTLLVDVIDRKWFGDEMCVSNDYEQCCTEHSQIRTLTQEKLDAVSP